MQYSISKLTVKFLIEARTMERAIVSKFLYLQGDYNKSLSFKMLLKKRTTNRK